MSKKKRVKVSLHLEPGEVIVGGSGPVKILEGLETDVQLQTAYNRDLRRLVKGLKWIGLEDNNNFEVLQVGFPIIGIRDSYQIKEEKVVLPAEAPTGFRFIIHTGPKGWKLSLEELPSFIG